MAWGPFLPRRSSPVGRCRRVRAVPIAGPTAPAGSWCQLVGHGMSAHKGHPPPPPPPTMELWSIRAVVGRGGRHRRPRERRGGAGASAFLSGCPAGLKSWVIGIARDTEPERGGGGGGHHRHTHRYAGGAPHKPRGFGLRAAAPSGWASVGTGRPVGLWKDSQPQPIRPAPSASAFCETRMRFLCFFRCLCSPRTPSATGTVPTLTTEVKGGREGVCALRSPAGSCHICWRWQPPGLAVPDLNSCPPSRALATIALAGMRNLFYTRHANRRCVLGSHGPGQEATGAREGKVHMFEHCFEVRCPMCGGFSGVLLALSRGTHIDTTLDPLVPTLDPNFRPQL